MPRHPWRGRFTLLPILTSLVPVMLATEHSQITTYPIGVIGADSLGAASAQEPERTRST
ncbi:hypothetical protein [Yersinia sp. Marseille-Q3913]|uniref:hypothetical protein n=1 Tax=Yersinia sp. Marseille-Q3913 TaxID=2830769 RepID=UPI001BB090DB|nr:hypothetical protein [Yersinia sp. Marseille-Q3913]MBS0054515.1 hypothetical protein [Yersinia sp. Marseille-Q3913]